MNTYLDHMQDIGAGTAYGRRVGYLRHNFRKYLDKLDANSRVLEIGPGTGELLHLLNNQGVTKIDIVDQDKGVLSYCKSKYKLSQVILSSGGDPSKYITDKYDLIVLTQVFEHIPKSEYQSWLTGLYAHLNVAGHIIITVPNGANPLVGTERYGDLQHENIFTIFSFRELMTFTNLKGSSYILQGFEIPPSTIINVIRIILQKILHGIFILMMIVNGGIYQTLMTPNITMIISKDKK